MERRKEEALLEIEVRGEGDARSASSALRRVVQRAALERGVDLAPQRSQVAVLIRDLLREAFHPVLQADVEAGHGACRSSAALAAPLTATRSLREYRRHARETPAARAPRDPRVPADIALTNPVMISRDMADTRRAASGRFPAAGRSLSSRPDVAERILVIDDEPDLLELVRVNLHQAGYRVETAESGRRGLEQLRRSKPDLVILDLMLPDLSGTELCRQVRADGELARTPIIMLTAKADEVDRVVGFELGADDYVTKPFSPRELTLRVAAVLRRKPTRAGAAAKLEHGPLSLDPERHRCFVDGRRGEAHGEGVRPARAADDPPGPGDDARLPARARLGRRHLGHGAHHRHPPQAPAREAGAGGRPD